MDTLLMKFSCVLFRQTRCVGECEDSPSEERQDDNQVGFPHRHRWKANQVLQSGHEGPHCQRRLGRL